MAVMYVRLRTLMQAAADAAGGMLKILLGTPGSQLEYPSSNVIDEKVSQTYDTGGGWATTQALPTVLGQVGAELDASLAAWAVIDTQATSVAPVVTAGRFVASATKNEGASTLTVVLSTSFSSAAFFTTGQLYLSGAGIPEVVGQAVNSVTLRWHDPAGGLVGINDVYVRFLAVGQAA